MFYLKKAGTTSTVAGETVREIINSADSGYGLHFDGAAGKLTFTAPDLGEKYSLEFIVSGDARIGDDGAGGTPPPETCPSVAVPLLQNRSRSRERWLSAVAEKHLERCLP